MSKKIAYLAYLTNFPNSKWFQQRTHCIEGSYSCTDRLLLSSPTNTSSSSSLTSPFRIMSRLYLTFAMAAHKLTLRLGADRKYWWDEQAKSFFCSMKVTSFHNFWEVGKSFTKIFKIRITTCPLTREHGPTYSSPSAELRREFREESGALALRIVNI